MAVQAPTNSGLLKTAARYFGGWILMVFFVVLLSFIFSFLGTIFCAALAGMMLGAIRQARWQAIPLSFTFPAVIFTLLRATRAELPASQINVLALLCFGIFWFTFAMTTAIVSFERKQPPAGSRAARSGLTAAAVAGGPVAATASVSGNGAVTELNLDVLQGLWRHDGAGLKAPSGQKLIEIEKENLVLRVSDARGKTNVLAKAGIRVERAGSLPTIVLAGPGCEPASDWLISI
jgi:hypothetical protein